MDETREISFAGAIDVLLRHAEDYPFDQLDRGFVYQHGEVHDGPLSLEGRIAVAASGSNGSPAQLQRKFGTCPEGIVVTTATVDHHAIVYSAHITRYGSMAATLWPEEDAAVEVAVTWLTERQLERMHETEALGRHYRFAQLNPARVIVDHPEHGYPLHYYHSLPGPLLHNQRPVRLAEIWTRNSALPVLTQPAALRYLHRRLASNLDFEDFIKRLIDDPQYRWAQMERLRNSKFNNQNS